MLAAMVIVVTCLFFLGIGLLISTNPLVVLALAAVGLILGGLVGVLLLRGRVAQGGYHWSVFVGPAASALLFVLLCGVLNILVSDNLGLALGGPRMYSVAMLLGTAPGLLIGLVLGSSFSGRGSRHSSSQLTHNGSQPRGSAGLRQPALPPRPPGPPLPPGPPTGGSAWPTPNIGHPDSAGLAARLAAETASLSRFGTVQLQDLRDGRLCASVTRPQDGATIYLVCSAGYPQQPPSVSVERHGAPVNVGTGILFPWDSTCRLEKIVADLMERVDIRG